MTYASASILSISSPSAGSSGHLSDHEEIRYALDAHDKIISNSASLANALSASGITGTGSVVFNTSPRLTSASLTQSSSAIPSLYIKGVASPSTGTGQENTQFQVLTSLGGELLRLYENAGGFGLYNYLSTSGQILGNVGAIITSGFPNRVALISKGVASQTYNLQEWQNSSGTVLAYVSPSGDFTASAGVATFGNASFRTDGNGFNVYSSASSEGGQINLYGGTSYSGSVMQIDNYQADMRVLYGNGSAVAITISNLSGSTTIKSLGLNAGTNTVAPLIFASGTNLSTSAAGAVEYDGKAFYGTTSTVGTGSRGVIPVTLFTSTNANTTLTNVNTAQAIFASTNDVITLAANTTYEMEMFFSSSVTASVSHTLNLAFAVGGTLTSISYLAHVSQNGTSAATLTAANNIWVNTNNSTAITAATAANAYRNVLVKGLVRSGTSGTFTPQIVFSAAPGNTGAIYPNAYLKLVPVGSDTTLATTAWS